MEEFDFYKIKYRNINDWQKHEQEGSFITRFFFITYQLYIYLWVYLEIWLNTVFYKYLFVNAKNFIIKSFWIYLTLFYHLFVPKKKRNLHGEVALVTGAGYGVGQHLCIKLARMGVVVICVDIDHKRNLTTKHIIDSEGGIAYCFQCDISVLNEIENLKRKVERSIGNVTILINNAGFRTIMPINQYFDDEIQKIIGVNLYGQLWLVRAFLPAMVSMNRGSIVCMSAIAGWGGFPNMLPWSAAKFAVRGLMEGLYIELRQQNPNHKVHLMTVAPFSIDSKGDGHVRGTVIRAPGLSNVVTAEKAARIVISNLQRQETVVFIPKIYFYLANWVRILPLRVQLLLTDFVDTGLGIEYDTHLYEERLADQANMDLQYQEWKRQRKLIKVTPEQRPQL